MVLMLENRSFDHVFGLSALAGVDALTGAPVEVEGLTGGETNSYGNSVAAIQRGAPFCMDFDPGHEFRDVVEQLCGPSAAYAPGGPYPPITNSGFAANAAARLGGSGAGVDPAIVMAAFTPDQLPVLNALAREFAVCDHWFSSIPGPTWPNRLFVHAATSGGLDDSPTAVQSATTLVEGYGFENGTIFDRLNEAALPWSIVEGDALPQALSLAGMVEHAVAGRFINLPTFLSRLQQPEFNDVYTFIEPHYGHVLADGRNFKCGNSMHPLDDVTRGEQLIKTVYEALRNSPHWNDAALILLYDEHGGFYDHVPPPAAPHPGDTQIAGLNRNGFTFDKLGVRVPALVVSSRTRRGVVDRQVYDHSAVPATIERLFALAPMTRRDATVNSLEHLFDGDMMRDDAPQALPQPTDAGIPDCEDSLVGVVAGDLEGVLPHLAGPLEPALAGFLQVAIARELQLATMTSGQVSRTIANERARLVETYRSIGSKYDAVKYLRAVESRFRSGPSQ
jgi:phospholipase C